MLIVKIMGGLGNQMFQYSYAKSLQETGHEVKIDITAFKTYKLHGGYQLDKYNIDLQESTKKENDKFYKDNIYSKVLRRIGVESSKAVREKSLLFDNTFLNIEDDNYIEVYFQSEKYFKNIRDILLKQFSIRENLSKYTDEIEKKILEAQNSCSIHIRRGDFVNATNINIHGSCDLEYYKKAIGFIEAKIGHINYSVFSNDIEWCKQNLEIKNATLIYSLNFANKTLKIVWSEAILNFKFSIVLIQYFGIGSVALGTALAACFISLVLPKVISELTTAEVIYDFTYGKKHFIFLVIPFVALSLLVVDLNIILKIITFVFVLLIYTLVSWKLFSENDKLVLVSLVKRKGHSIE